MVLPFMQGSFWKHSAPILILQLCWFSNQGGQLIKDANFFSCTESESDRCLVVPITVEDEVSFTNKYSVIATINHSCTLTRGHSLLGFYQGLTLTHSWYSCNNKLVLNVEERSLNKNTKYILFYRKVWMFRRIYQKFWRFFSCFILFVFARRFWHLRQGVSWPHIKPQSCTGIEFAYSIFRIYNPAVLNFGEALQGGSIKHGLVYEEWRPHI